MISLSCTAYAIVLTFVTLAVPGDCLNEVPNVLPDIDTSDLYPDAVFNFSALMQEIDKVMTENNAALLQEIKNQNPLSPLTEYYNPYAPAALSGEVPENFRLKPTELATFDFTVDSGFSYWYSFDIDCEDPAGFCNFEIVFKDILTGADENMGLFGHSLQKYRGAVSPRGKLPQNDVNRGHHKQVTILCRESIFDCQFSRFTIASRQCDPDACSCGLAEECTLTTEQVCIPESMCRAQAAERALNIMGAVMGVLGFSLFSSCCFLWKKRKGLGITFTNEQLATGVAKDASNYPGPNV